MNNKQLISKLEYSILLVFPIITIYNFINLNINLDITKIDSYISILYSAAIGLILIYIYINIFNYQPQLTLTEKNINLFGKIIGTLINYILALNIIITSIIIINNITNFIVIHYLKETPKLIVLLLIGLTILYNSSKDIQSITRTSFIIFVIIIIITMCSTIGLITKFNIINILPTLNNGIDKPIKSGNIIIITNIMPLYILLNIPKDIIKDNKDITKYIIILYLISMFLIFILTFLITGILGENLLNIYAHPEYTILKKISLFGFIDHIENIVYIKWILSSITTLILITNYIKNTVTIKKDNMLSTLIVTLIIISTLFLLYKNNININNYIIKKYYYINIITLSTIIIIYLKIIINKKRSL